MGERIQDRRLEVGLTQAELGQLLGVGQEAVSRWEAGLVEIGTDDLRSLGRVLQAPTGWFMEGTLPKPKPYVPVAYAPLDKDTGVPSPRPTKPGKGKRA